ncbi:hypothetical protein [Streptomyces yangpuensis]|uniref:hypothetical protein n=1 Tax=Streptomyces yangpuensis TaxID=1648182 RepID=UPI00382F1102
MPRLDPVDTRVVKTFVTQEQETVVNPAEFGGGDHTMFPAGDHEDAKTAARQLLTSYGWSDIVDAGPRAGWRCTPTSTPRSASPSAAACGVQIVR